MDTVMVIIPPLITNFLGQGTFYDHNNMLKPINFKKIKHLLPLLIGGFFIMISWHHALGPAMSCASWCLWPRKFVSWQLGSKKRRRGVVPVASCRVYLMSNDQKTLLLVNKPLTKGTVEILTMSPF